jgi:hypothetical protein
MQPQRLGKQVKPRSTLGKYAPYFAGAAITAAHMYPAAVAAAMFHQIGKKK